MSDSQSASKGAFINPQRMQALGLHHLGSSQPAAQSSSRPAQHHQTQMPPVAGGFSFSAQPTAQTTPYQAPPPYQPPPPYQASTQSSYPSAAESKAPASSSFSSSAQAQPTKGRRRAVPASTFKGFSYDERFRPRPKKTTTKWGIKPTIEQLQRQVAIKLGVPTDNPVESLRTLGLPEATLWDFDSMLEIVRSTTTPIGPGAPGNANKALHAQLAMAQAQAIGADLDAVKRPSERQPSPYKVYVGGVPPLCTDQEIGDLFNVVILSVPERTAPRDVVPVKAVNTKPGYAFVELNSKEDLEIALSMDGIDLRGHILKIKLPKDSPFANDEFKRHKIPGLIPTHVENGPYKVFLGNIPPTLDERMLKAIISEFGQLAAFNLVRDPVTNASKRYAFFLLEDTSRTLPTVTALNGFKLGDYVLTCSLALSGRQNSEMPPGGTSPAPLTLASATSGASFSGVPAPAQGSNDQQFRAGAVAGAPVYPSVQPQAGQATPQPGSRTPLPKLKTPLPAPPPLEVFPPQPTGEPSRVLVMQNMVTEEMLKREYDDIALDTREEFKQFGAIKSISGMGALVYLVFEDLESAKRAAIDAHGRVFDGHKVCVQYMPEHIWEQLRQHPEMGPMR